MDTILIGDTKFVNLCPHVVNLKFGEEVYAQAKSVKPARLVERREKLGGVLTKTTFIGTENIPKKENGTIFIVSMLIKDLLKRPDFVSPSGVARDAAGNIIGCDSFATCSEISEQLLEEINAQ